MIITVLRKVLVTALQRRFALAGVSVAAVVVMVVATLPPSNANTIPSVALEQATQGLESPLESTTEPEPAAASGFTLAVRRQNRFVWPATGPITSYFGLGHPTGIDIGLDPGSDTPVRASAAGTVSFAGGNACCSYGYHVVIDHEGSTTLYGHLSQISVEVGQAVAQGEVIGLGGSTGESDGKHLHFELELGGVVFDPLRFLSAQQEGRGAGEEMVSCAGAPIELDPASLLNLRLVNGSETDLQIEQVALSPLTSRATFSPEARSLGLVELEVGTPPIPTASGETYAFRLEIWLKDAPEELTVACDLSLKTRRTLANPFTQRRTAAPPPPTPTPTPLRWERPTLTPRPTSTPFRPGPR